MAARSSSEGAIEKRGPNSWRVQVRLGRDPVTGAYARRRFTVRGSRRDAQRALREALHERDNGLNVAPENVGVEDWLRRWLAQHRADGHITERTYDRYGGIIEKHLIPGIGGLRLQKLRSDHLAELKTRWLTGDAASGSRALAGATVNKHLVVLRRALDEAVHAGLLMRNPMDAVRAPSGKPPRERRALDEPEIALLLDAADETKYAVPIRVAIATGLRQGEMLGLRWSDVNLDEARLAVQRSASYVSSGTIYREPKRNSRRTIELSGATVKVLREHRIAQTEERLRLGSVWQDHGLVFPSQRGTPWIARGFYRGYRRIVDGSRVTSPETVNWHTLRHTAGSQWISHGADIFTVSRRLGHASATFTMDVYGHLLRGQQREAAEALDHLIG